MRTIISQATTDGVRPPAVAGQFYPANAERLRHVIEAYLQAAPLPHLTAVRAVIAPHAGYLCSGVIAAHSFKALRTLPDNIPYTVYLLGPTHWQPVHGAGLTSAASFVTPLGSIPVAQGCVERLLALGEPYHLTNRTHMLEHCVEVELPFLQMVLPILRIVPLLVDEGADPVRIGTDLARLMAADTHALIVVSSDLSHYAPYAQAVEQDQRFLQAVVEQDRQRVAAGQACGLMAILVLMDVAARLGWRAYQLAYANSGDTCGSKTAVVGYGALAYTALI